jgi:hypothetical protein
VHWLALPVEYPPAEQFWQCVAFPPEKRPALHTPHSQAPGSAANDPAGQAEQAELASAPINEPGWQSSHWEAAPVVNLPLVHASQAHAPASPANRPAGQSRQVEACCSANDPAGQARQAVDAVALENVPSSHQWQAPFEA